MAILDVIARGVDVNVNRARAEGQRARLRDITAQEGILTSRQGRQLASRRDTRAERLATEQISSSKQLRGIRGAQESRAQLASERAEELHPLSMTAAEQANTVRDLTIKQQNLVLDKATELHDQIKKRDALALRADVETKHVQIHEGRRRQLFNLSSSVLNQDDWDNALREYHTSNPEVSMMDDATFKSHVESMGFSTTYDQKQHTAALQGVMNDLGHSRAKDLAQTKARLSSAGKSASKHKDPILEAARVRDESMRAYELYGDEDLKTMALMADRQVRELSRKQSLALLKEHENHFSALVDNVLGLKQMSVTEGVDVDTVTETTARADFVELVKKYSTPDGYATALTYVQAKREFARKWEAVEEDGFIKLRIRPDPEDRVGVLLREMGMEDPTTTETGKLLELYQKLGGER